MGYFEEGINLIKVLNSLGYSSFIVGGAVRDYLLKEDFHDIDIATSALPKTLEEHFYVRNTGLKYNSLTVIYNGYEFEVTTFRIDLSYQDHRHPQYLVADNLEADLKRRDFTINALAIDQNLNVIDLFDGKKDLAKKEIRAIGNPAIRFEEDALRMLRAIYFSSKLAFKIENMTLKAIKEKAYLIQTLSFDRIRSEIEKIVLSKYPFIGYQNLLDTNVLSYLGVYFKGIKLILKHQIEVESLLEFDALCFYQENFSQLENSLKKNLMDIYYLFDKNLLDPYILFKFSLANIIIANKIRGYYGFKQIDENKIKEAHQNLPIDSLTDLQISGKQIIEITGLEGAIVGELYDKVLEEVLNKKLKNDYLEIKKFLIKKGKKKNERKV